MAGPRPAGTTTITSIDVHAEGEAGRIPFIHQGVLGTTFRGMLHESTATRPAPPNLCAGCPRAS